MFELQHGEPEVGERSGAASDRYLTARQVCERYGVSFQSLWRWLKRADLNFPQPLYIGRYRYFSSAALVAWEREQAAAQKADRGLAQEHVA